MLTKQWLVLVVLVLTVTFTYCLNNNESEKVIFPRVNFTARNSTRSNIICNEQIALYQNSLANLTLWAHEMWDASAKYPAGVLRGNMYQMGDWSECMTIHGPYKTQYCLTTIEADVPPPDPPRDPISLYYSPFESVLHRIYKIEDVTQQSRHVLKIGLCLPASCRPEDLEEILNEYLLNNEDPMKQHNVSYKATVLPTLCQKENDEANLDSTDISFLSVSLLLVVTVIASGIFKCSQQSHQGIKQKPSKEHIWTKIWLAFSPIRNFRQLSKSSESNAPLNILYGTKVFCICMVIMDHRLGLTIVASVSNYDFVEKLYRSRFTSLLFRGDLFVDSFFLLSGLLVTYGLLVQFDKKVINSFLIITLRYIRLTPLYAFVIFFYASVFYHTGSGPLWNHIIGPEVKDCRTNWWTSLLYISNYVNDTNMCMVHLWYLPCDFQFFIIGVLVTRILSKHKKQGLALLIILFMASSIVPFVITVVYLRPAVIKFSAAMIGAPKLDTDFRLTYSKSHTRAQPYVIGMFAGYIFYKCKQNPKYLSRVTSHVLTTISLCILVACVVSGSVFYDPYHDYNAFEAGFYAGLHRAVWAIGSVGLLFTASYGHASIIKSILSWSPWIPLSKLVYGAYLIHMCFPIRGLAITTFPKRIVPFDMFCMVLSDIVVAFVSALVLYLTIEAPIQNVFKLLFGFSRPRGDNKPSLNGISSDNLDVNQNNVSRL